MVRAHCWYVAMSMVPSLFSLALIATALSRVPPFTEVKTLSTRAFPSTVAVQEKEGDNILLSQYTLHRGLV